jgi:hypothetical protein
VRLYRILQLAVFVSCPCSRTPIRPVDAAVIQGLMPSDITLSLRSTRNQRGNRTPILATVRFNRILQLHGFVFCPFTLTSFRPFNIGIQDIMPSVPTLLYRSTRNQRSNRTPILATVQLYSILQLDVFVLCPFTNSSIRPVDAEIQELKPSAMTLLYRSTRNECCNSIPIYLVLLAVFILGGGRNCVSQLSILY